MLLVYESLNEEAKNISIALIVNSTGVAPVVVTSCE